MLDRMLIYFVPIHELQGAMMELCQDVSGITFVTRAIDAEQALEGIYLVKVKVHGCCSAVEGRWRQWYSVDAAQQRYLEWYKETKA